MESLKAFAAYFAVAAVSLPLALLLHWLAVRSLLLLMKWRPRALAAPVRLKHAAGVRLQRSATQLS